MTPRALLHLERAVEELRGGGRLRSDAAVPTEGLISLCSNDYLALAGEGVEALGVVPGGAGASRLVFGEKEAHRRAEQAFCDWLGYESALLFSSGYAANVGALGALVAPGDTVVSDALNHASIIDGCRLAGATVRVVPHLDLCAVEEALRTALGPGKRWVVTEAYFSMDGDAPDLVALRALCDRYEAGLVVDEAHSLGIFGQEGRGLCDHAGVRPEVLVLGCGKALGAQGGVVLGPAVVRTWLWNKARSFVFSTGVSPVLAQLLEARVKRVREGEGLRIGLRTVVEALRSSLQALGLGTPGLAGPILPWVLGKEERALEAAHWLRAQGVLAQAIRPPTVPPGTARLRLSARADLQGEQLERVVAALAGLGKCFT